MNGGIVVDASVIGAWMLKDIDNQYVNGVIEHIFHTDTPIIVPTLFFDEVLNLLLKAYSIARINQEVFNRCLKDLLQMGHVFIVSPYTMVEQQFYQRALLAQKHNLRSYDAVYLSLALTQGINLATADKRLARAATVEGCYYLQ